MGRETFWYKVNNEGIGYAITDYFGRDIASEGLDDPEFVEQWAKAYDALSILNSRLMDWEGNFEVED